MELELCMMMSVSTVFIGLNVVSSVSICLVTLGTVVDFYFIFYQFLTPPLQ